jgi:dTDP-4-dehydrorhamnose reductase
MISILVTGAKGQLGNELHRASENYPGMQFHHTDIEELDITDAQAVKAFLAQNPVQFIVNCAAYTAVDRAEEDPENAMQLNARAVAILAEAAAGMNIQLMHISTDYVFSGENNRPYKTDDPVNPQTVYGKTKLEGENALSRAGTGIIIRTSWLYSVFGNNFVKTILRLSREKETLRVVFDQTGSPTNARDLAMAILDMITVEAKHGRQPRYDVYHFANEGICSWFEFAREIISLSGNTCEVEPVTSDNYPTAAVRPRYSVLDRSRILADYGFKIPHWKDSLDDCMKELNKQTIK